MKKILVLLLVLSMILTGCNGGKNNEPSNQTSTGDEETSEKVQKDTLIFAQGADVTSFDPHVGKETPAITVTDQIFDTLTSTDDDMNVQPGIAESWEQLSETSYKFKLREDVKFHNGEPLTAEDVKFSLDRAVASSYVSYIVNFISDVEVVDDYTVIVNTHEPYAPILMNLAHPSTGIVCKSVVEDDPDSLKVKPIGSGPYKFVEWKQGDSVKLEAFEDYYLGEPPTKYVVMRVIPENAQRTIALETGEIDIAYDLSANDIDKVKENDKLDVLTTKTSSVGYISFNVEKAPFDDVRVRQAIAHAIDKELIIETLLYGQGAVANSVISEVVFGGVEGLEGLEYNPEKAKELLKEVGVKEGTEFTICVNDNQVRIETCQVIQGLLNDIGLNLKIEVLEFGALIEKTTKKQHDLAFFAWVTSTSDADYTYYPLFHSSMHGAPGNRSFYSNPEVDKLIEAGRTNSDYAEREKIYKEIAEILAEEVPSLPIFFQNMSVGINKNVEGFNINPIGYHKLHTVKVYE